MGDVPGWLRDALYDGQISRRQFVVTALQLGASVTGAATVLAACGSSSPSGMASSSATGRLKGTIQIFVGFGTGNQPSQTPVQQALAEAFMRQNPGVTINFLRVPQDARTRFTVLLAGGSPPDIVMPVGLYGISLFVDQNVWLDLAPFMQRDGVSLDAFDPVTREATHVPNYYGSNSSTVVGLPVGVHDHALAYNADLFAKAGVPEPPASWHDDSWSLDGKFLETAKALTVDGNGKHPDDSGFDAGNIVRFGVGHFFREAVYYDFGGHLYDPHSRKAQFDTEGSIAGIQFAADLVNRYHVQPSQTQVAALGAGAEKGNEEQFAWRNGKLAMIDMCSCDIRSPFGTDVPFAWKAAAMPRGPARRFCFLNLDVGAIVARSGNHDLAWEVLKYFAVDPANERRLAFDSYGAVPPLKENEDAFPKGIKAQLPSVNPQEWLDGFPFASPENEAWFPAFAQVNDLIGKTFDRIVSGSVAASVAMPQLQRDAQAQIDQWFATHKLP